MNNIIQGAMGTSHDSIQPQCSDGLNDFPESRCDRMLLRIIIVEDSYADFDDIARCLRKMECYDVEITRAKTIEDARFAMSNGEFDVALIDFYLGNESGARMLRELTQYHPEIVPILITGQDNEKVQDIALNEGAIGCINKEDISIKLMETTLRYCIHNHQKEQELKDMILKVSKEPS